MRTIHWIIIGVLIPVALFGIFVLAVIDNVIQNYEPSDNWMVELEPHLDLTEEGLAELIRNDEGNQESMKREGKPRAIINDIEYLDDFVKDFPSDIHGKLEDADRLDNRFVLSIDKNSGYSEDELREGLMRIDGIKDAQIVNDWILGKD